MAEIGFRESAGEDLGYVSVEVEKLQATLHGRQVPITKSERKRRAVKIRPEWLCANAQLESQKYTELFRYLYSYQRPWLKAYSFEVVCRSLLSNECAGLG